MKPMRRRDLVKALEAAGARPLRSDGRHEVWACPCGGHRAPVTQHREVTVGVVRSIIKQMPCLPEGAIQ